jgi:hypothetical protein
MRDLVVLFIHFIATLARSVAAVAEVVSSAVPDRIQKLCILPQRCSISLGIERPRCR